MNTIGEIKKNKIRLAFFGDDFNRKAKGTAIVVQKLADEFLREEDQIELIAIHKGIAPEKKNPGIRYVPVKIYSLPVLKTIFSYIIFFIRSKEVFDLVIFNRRVYPGFWLLKAKRRALLLHNAPLNAVYQEKMAFSARCFDLFLKYIGKHFLEIVVAGSEDARQEIIHYYRMKPSQVVVIYYGASDEFKPLREIERENARIELEVKYAIKGPYILDVSRFDPHKNIKRLVEAFALFQKKSREKYTLIILGNRHTEKYAAAVDEEIRTQGVGSKVKIISYVEGKDLPLLYNCAEVFIFPSLMEGFGLPLVEAMRSGTPIITSNISSMPEIVGEAGITINPLDIEAMAEALEKVLIDSSLREDMIKKGLVQGQKFSWRDSAKQLISSYENTLRR